eukprot:snap_masked-scaffold_72-processed-gene-0.35-mRNA-1 protein AED:0.04 eAED:0.04 QI:0/0/0/0.5/1/1/2/0/324
MGARVSARPPEEGQEENLKQNMEKSSEAVIPEGTFWGFDVPFDELGLEDAVGHGTYGKVYKANYKGYKIAVKKLFLSTEPEERAEILEDFAKEVKILSMLKHKNIVQFLGATRKDPNYCLITELCEGSVGSLLSTVKKGTITLSWEMCLKIASDCAEAMVYLHGLNPKILHRDLKAENLLIDSQFNCKLTDFGLSRGYEAKSVMTVCGTPCWVAPEIFRGEAYTESVDVYAFAIVLWELFCFEKPYSDQDGVELPFLVAKENLRPPLLKHCPDFINDLMVKAWDNDMNARPPFTQILESLSEFMIRCEPFKSQPIDPSLKSPPG